MPESKMPALGRFPSFSKRHASFNSPREMPLPSPVLTHPDTPNPFFVSTTPPHSPTNRHRLHLQDPSRPMSIPESQSTDYSYLTTNSPPRSTTWLDRNSSASLPLPTQVPFYALQRSRPHPDPCPSITSSNSSSSSSTVSDSSVATSESETTLSKRPISPFRAPRPPSPQPQPVPEPTAMRRQPHTLPTELPQPDPPIILDSTLPDSSSSLSSSSAPYAPFLSHAPPPADCRLEISTSESYYRLDVRLPGFTREGITLATKRRRILHVVADMWDNGGGHFERRVAFGYDADLGHVRAEFDGCVLRIVIPRRTAGVFLGR